VRIAIGSDHAGVLLKMFLKEFLAKRGDEVQDVGTGTADQVDYSDFAEAVAVAVLKGNAHRGVLICGSGVGASVAANKVRGIRAGLCHDTYSAHQGVEHDNMNVLVLGARVIGQELARELVQSFVTAEFTNEDRHLRRLAKVAAIEKRYGTKTSDRITEREA
jgi:RpiB/LacA/LacB family sugar-phosphate isomerase